MGKREKFYERLKTKPKDIKFDELENFLRAQGFIVDSKGGSSHVFFKYEETKLTIPKHGIVKRCYIEQVLDVIELYNIKIR